MLQRFDLTETLIFNQNIKVLNAATWFIIFPQYRDINQKSPRRGEVWYGANTGILVQHVLIFTRNYVFIIIVGL